MHEPPRTDAAGLQTPDRYRADEGPDGGWRLTNKRTALVSRAQLGEWCKAEDVDATLAALRARTEGLQHENRELRDAPELLRGSIACLEKQLAALRASHETLQAERDQLQVSIEAFNHHEHDREGAAMVWRDLYEQERARVTALDAERDALQQQLKEWKRSWLLEKERHGNA